MKIVRFKARDVNGAREEILNFIQRNISNSVIYFHGWGALGTSAVLTSLAQVLPSMRAPPPELCFGRIVFIDCSTWTSKRAMQRKIAQELRLGPEIIAMFDEQDEEDDFNGLDLGSRDPIRSAAVVIDQTLRESRFIMIFLNGSDDEIHLTSTFGIPEYNDDSIMIWTYSKSFVTLGYDINDAKAKAKKKFRNKFRHTDVCLASYHGVEQLSSSEFIALLREEAGSIVDRYPCVQDMDVTTVLDCCLYELLLRPYRFGTMAEQAPNYWICDGIIQGDRALETSNALHPLIQCDDNSISDAVLRNLKEGGKAPFLLVEDDDDVYEKRPYRWIFFRLTNNKALEDMQAILPGASSIFLAFGTTTRHPPGLLPNSLFKCCSNLGVLVLFRCAFSFISPPFLHCHTLRFLGLYFCTDDNNSAAELEGGGWACLQSLRVICLSHTECVEMLLSEDKMELMANLIELNIQRVRWSNRLQMRRLPYLRRLRIMNLKYDEAETSSSSDDMIIRDSFLMDKTNLEVLDLSGNGRAMRNLPASISKASHLQVLIVNYCHGLENVVVPNGLPSSLRSFSFNCYGSPASKISLQGCTRLDNLFIRSLYHLVELDLSGCAIKVLDFGTMVVEVPMLKRLFLLGCEHLRSIKWVDAQARILQLLCVDTRPGTRRVPGSLGALKKSTDVQVHAITADARMARSLCDPLRVRDIDHNVYFNINITASSTAACGGVVVQQGPESTASKEMTAESSVEQHGYAVAGPYSGDVFTQAGCDPTPMRAFPQPLTRQLDRHVEIGHGSHNVQSEVELEVENPQYEKKLAWLMMYTQSLLQETHAQAHRPQVKPFRALYLLLLLTQWLISLLLVICLGAKAHWLFIRLPPAELACLRLPTAAVCLVLK